MKIICEVPTYGTNEDGQEEQGVALKVMNDVEPGEFILIETPENIYKVYAYQLYEAIQRTRFDGGEPY